LSTFKLQDKLKQFAQLTATNFRGFSMPIGGIVVLFYRATYRYS